MSRPGAHGRIVRWEVLNGLPGEGPPPKHFHLGHPTPWSEGVVIRFWNEDGTEWVGNFQGGIYGLDTSFDWAEADFVVVFANGACYFIHTNEPNRWVVNGTNAVYALFDEQGSLLIVAYEGGDLIAFERNGLKRWVRRSFGALGVVLKSCEGGVVTAEVETDYEDSWRTAQIKTIDGSDV